MAVMREPQLGRKPGEVGLSFAETVERETEAQPQQVATDAFAGERPELPRQVEWRAANSPSDILEPPSVSRLRREHLAHRFNAASLHRHCPASCWTGPENSHISSYVGEQGQRHFLALQLVGSTPAED
jgi:hypothetical protein